MKPILYTGIGALGKAILDYENFKNYGLNITAVYDSDQKKVDEKIFGIK